MLDKTDDLGLDTSLDIPAISVQLATTIGQTRSLTLTTGIRLDCTKAQLDNVLDKITAAANRQKVLHDLEQTRQLLKNEEQSLHLHRQQLSSQETRFQAEWAGSGRRGDWRPAGGQAKVLEGLSKNIENSVERIKTLRNTIAEMEGQCR